MRIYYDVILENNIKKRSVSYWADSFSVDENRILRVISQECGNVTVMMDVNDRLIVRDILVEDEFDNVIMC